MVLKSIVHRRQFLRRAAAAGAAVASPMIISSSAWGSSERPAPSKRITVGCIGVGAQGNGNLGGFLGDPRCQVLAVCDVDRSHVEGTRRRVDGHYGNKDCRGYRDFRKLLAPRRYRCHLAGHSRSLARRRGDPGRQVGQRYLRRKTVQP